MTDPNSIQRLSNFYKKLDQIPTPALTPKKPSGWTLWGILIAPLGASLLAFAFISMCASGPADPNAVVPIRIPADRYTLEDPRPEPLPQKPGLHVMNGSIEKGAI